LFPLNPSLAASLPKECAMTVRTSFDPELSRKIVRKIALFATLTDDDICQLLERTNVYSCRKGEIIFLKDDEIQQMYIILKGLVKVVEITADGQERVMAYRQRGDYFGDMGLLDGRTEYATVVATEACKLMVITKVVFDQLFMENTTALRGIIGVLCGRLRESWMFHAIIGANDAESKIRVTLARYGKLWGVKDSSGVIINSNISHQGLADRVLITRETASRVLGRMRGQGEIEIVGGRRIKLLPAFFDRIDQCALYNSLRDLHGDFADTAQ
jgi:CRP/FNR family transcriptional regulator, cyclic AMP receptor protein